MERKNQVLPFLRAKLGDSGLNGICLAPAPMDTPMTDHNVHNQLYLWHQLKEQLMTEHGLAPDDQALLDTLEGETNLVEMVIKALRSSREDAAKVEALKKIIDEMKERQVRLETRADDKRSFALKVMQEAGLPRVEAPDFTASLSATQPSVKIIDEKLIPEKFLEPQPPKLKKAEIKEALKNGQEVLGAILSNGGQTLKVSTR